MSASIGSTRIALFKNCCYYYSHSGDYRDIRALIGRQFRHIWLYSERGDYNTEALIFKMASAQFLDYSEEETNKMKEKKNKTKKQNKKTKKKTVALIIT